MQQTVPLLRRDLDFIPVEHENQQFVLVRDPLGLVREGQALPLPLFKLLAELTPGGSLSDMQALLLQHSGGKEAPTMEQMRRMVAELDEAFLLESEGYLQAKDNVMQSFVAGDARPAVMAGQAYPDDPETLRTWLDATMIAAEPAPEDLPPLRALVAPHIDPGIGAGIYAQAYAALHKGACDQVIVLGVGHQLGEGLFSCSGKEFSTPFGALPRATELNDALLQLRAPAGQQANPAALMAPDDFIHRNEHSIEFQLVFLQHLLGAQAFSLTPLLCGSLLYGLPDYTRQAFQDAAGPVLELLQQALADSRTLLVAGVDFSHIGPKFGQEQTARDLEKETREHDQALLERLAARDADGFWQESARVRDRYNVCGFAALATLLEVLPPCEGQVLGYELWHEEPTTSAVSFAAAAFR